MRTNSGRFIFSLLLILSSRVYGAAPYDENLNNCSQLLIAHVNAPLIHPKPWSALPGYLENIDGGTLLVQLDLGSSTFTLADLMKLGEPTEGVQIPEALKMIHGKTLVFVAHGSRAALLGFYNRIQESPIADAASFRFLNYLAVQLQTRFPSVVIQHNEDWSADDIDRTEAEIQKQIRKRSTFAVYNVRRNRLAFFFPRHTLMPQINSDFWRSEKVDTSILRVTPDKWTRWLAGKSDILGKRIAILVGDWAVLSPVAYAKALELSRVAADLRPTVEDVDQALRQALANCFSIACEVAAPVVIPAANSDLPSDELTDKARLRIIQLLKRTRDGFGLNDPFGLRKSANSLARFVQDQAKKEEFKKALRGIEFTANDYPMISRNPPYPAAVARLVKVWRLFLIAVGSPYANEPLTFSNVVQSIRLIEIE